MPHPPQTVFFSASKLLSRFRFRFRLFVLFVNASTAVHSFTLGRPCPCLFVATLPTVGKRVPSLPPLIAVDGHLIDWLMVTMSSPTITNHAVPVSQSPNRQQLQSELGDLEHSQSPRLASRNQTNSTQQPRSNSRLYTASTPLPFKNTRHSAPPCLSTFPSSPSNPGLRRSTQTRPKPGPSRPHTTRLLAQQTSAGLHHSHLVPPPVRLDAGESCPRWASPAD